MKDNDELDFKLSNNTGETNTLYATNRTTVLDRIAFPGNNTIPTYWAPDISYGRLPDGSSTTMRFATNRTTPGKSNFQPLTNIVVNELIAHTDLPLEDAVEFFNPTDTPVDIGNWWLSNSTDDRKKWRIPTNTIIQPYGFKVFYEMVNSTNGFNTNGTGTNRCFTFNSAKGDQVVLTAASNDASGSLTGYELTKTFGPSQNGVSFGRYITSDGNKEFIPMLSLTFGTNVTRDDPTNRIWAFRSGKGATNSYPLVGPLVISELMYHPPDIVIGTNHIDDSTNEYVEIMNITSTNTPLYDSHHYYYDFDYSPYPYADGYTNTWRIRGDIEYDFPTNIVLGPGKFLVVVNFDPTNTVLSNIFCQKYSAPTNVWLFGPYKNKLSNKECRVELQKPDWPQGPNHPEDFGLVPYLYVERIHYYDSGLWPTNADGYGYSLHRVSPSGYVDDPTNWVAAVPSPGRQQMLTINSQTNLVNDTNLVISFMSLGGSSYSVQYRGDVSTGPWTNVVSFDALPTNYFRSVTNPITGIPSRIYRVVSPKQP